MDGIRDTVDVFVTLLHTNGGNTCNEEHAGNDAELSSNKEGSKVVVVVGEEDFTGLLGEPTFPAFGLEHLCNSEVGNLGSFEDTNATQKYKEDDDRCPSRNTFPHGGTSSEECLERDHEGEDEKSKGPNTSQIEECLLKDVLWWFIGFDGLSS